MRCSRLPPDRSGTAGCERGLGPLTEVTRGVAAVLLLLILSGIPALAAEYTLDPGDSIQAAINAAADNDTLILNPGTFAGSGMLIAKNITIRANTSSGGTPAGTVIDAAGAGTIFSLSPGTICLFDNLTLANGHAAGDGGAILVADGPAIVTLSSSVIRNCSARNGGAIAIRNGSHAIVINSDVSGCSAERGGAFSNRDGSSLFLIGIRSTGCSAVYGGTVHDNEGSLSLILGSAIANTSAKYGGAIFHDNGNTLTVIGSNITRASAVYGGAVWAGNGSAFALADSVIADSSARIGGAVYDTGRSRFFSGRGSFTNCSATVAGGAIWAAGSNLTTDIAASAFTGCSVNGGTGGAVAFDAIRNFTITTSTFTGCSARNGSAVFSNRSTGTMRFSRIVRNSGNAIHANGGALSAAWNWWGANAGPGGSVTGTVTSAPWLVLGIDAERPIITFAENSLVRANLRYDSAGGESPGPDLVPDGIPVAFSASAGSVEPASGSTIAGTNATTFFPAMPGIAFVSATVDNQTVLVPVTVVALPAGDSGDAVSGGDTYPGELPATAPATSNITVGGNSAISRAVVTGTGIAGLVITGTRQDGPGTNISPPPGTVYQYIGLVPAGYRTITRATIFFSVPLSWLADNRLSPQEIALWHHTANGWVALPTTAGSIANGFACFTASTPGFALFAIAGRPSITVPAGPVVQSVAPDKPTVTTSVTLANPLKPVSTVSPVRTTIAPVPPVTTAGGLPLIAIVAGILGGAGIAAAVVLTRRWWIQRQNPALFQRD